MDKCNASYKACVLNLCLISLTRAGFRRYRKDSVDYPINNNFTAWVGLNTGLYPDHVEINPFVGVTSANLDKMWFGLSGKKYPGPNARPATYAIHLGELESARNEFAFAFAPKQSDAFVKAECDRLAALYKMEGLTFAKSIASYEALLPFLRKKVSMLGGYPERVACCLHLLGRNDEARQFVEQFRQAKPNYFEPFASAFMMLVDQRRD